MKMVIRGFWALILAVAFAGPLQADEKDFGQPCGTVVVPDGLPEKEVQKAITLAALGRGWTVKDKDDSKVVLFLEQGGWRSTLTLTYDDEQVQIYSNSDKLDRNGRPKKHAVPTRWVDFLKQDITKHLAEASFNKS